MAALSITPGSVRDYGTVVQGIAGGTLTAGLVLTINTSSQLVAASNSSAVNAAVAGIALNGASVNQRVDYLIAGNLDIGATVAVGKVYVLGTAGGIIPVDDVAGGEFITVVGVGLAASGPNCFKFCNVQSGVAAAGAVT
jgi:hypothetical protein